MAKVANAGVSARQRARQRQAGAWGASADGDRRVGEAVSAGRAAIADRVAVDRRLELALEAARLAALEAERMADRDRAEAGERLTAAVRTLRAERASLARIAELLDVPVTQVRQLTREPVGADPRGPDVTGGPGRVSGVVA